MAGQQLKSHPLIMLVDEVARLQGRVTSLFAGVQAESGLRSMENLVLNAIVEADSAPTVPRIGRSLGHPRQVIQRAVNSLAAAGLVRRLPNPGHKRAPLLAVTPRGARLKRRSDALALAVADGFLERFDARTCTGLARDLGELRRAIEAVSRESPDADRAPSGSGRSSACPGR